MMTTNKDSGVMRKAYRVGAVLAAATIWVSAYFIPVARAAPVDRPGDYTLLRVNRHIQEILDEMPIYDPATQKMSHDRLPSSRLRQAVDDLQREWLLLFKAKDLHDLSPPSRDELFKRCYDFKKQVSGPIVTKLELERELLLLKQRQRFVDSARKQMELRNWIAIWSSGIDLVKEVAGAIKSVLAPTPKDVVGAFKGIIKKMAKNAMSPTVANPAGMASGSLNKKKLGEDGLKYFLENADEMAAAVDGYVKQRNFLPHELRDPKFLANELKLFVRDYLRKKANEELHGVSGDPSRPGLGNKIIEVEKKLIPYSTITITPGQYKYKEYESLCKKISDLPDWTPRTVVGLRIDPATPSIQVGQSVTFTAIGRYPGGTEFDFTDKVSWPDGKKFTGTGPGKFPLGADYRSLHAVADITVTTTSSAKDLKISPDQITIGEGETATFKATAEFWDGSFGDVTAVAIWDNGPLFTATQTGTFPVTVRYLGKSAVATVTVTQLPPLPPGLSVDRLVVDPSDAIISIGETATFSARATFSDGSQRDVTLAATWTPASSFTADKAEIVTIVAAYGGISAQVFLVVTPDPGPRSPVTGPSGTGTAGKYNILFRPNGSGRPNCFQFYLAAVGGRAVASPGILTPLGTREGWSVDSAYGAGSQAGWSWAFPAAASSRMSELSIYGGDAYGCRNNGFGSQPPPTAGVGQVSPLPPGVKPYGVWRRKSAIDANRPNCYEFASAALSSPDNFDSELRKREGWVREPNFFGPYSPRGASAVLSQLSRYGGDYYYCIRQRPPVAVLVNPSAQSIGLGEEANLQALAYYEDGTTRDISKEAKWSRATPFYGASSGVYTITASYQGLTGSGTVTVTDSAVIGLTISSPQDVYDVGQSAYFTATVVYSDGTTRVVSADPDLTWDPNDYITGDKEGVYHVRATYKGIQGTRSVRFEKDSASASAFPLSIAGLSVAGVGGGTAISAGAPMSAGATLSIGEFSGIIAVEWRRLSDGAGSGDIQVLTAAPNTQIPVATSFPKMAAGIGGVTYDSIQLTVSDGADLSVQATVDFEWKQGDAFLGFVFENAETGKPGTKFEIGEMVMVSAKWKATDDIKAGNTRKATYFVNGSVFHEEAGVPVHPGKVVSHAALLDTKTLHKGTLSIRSDFYDPKADTVSSGQGKLYIAEGKDRITGARASLSQSSGGGKTFTSGKTVYVCASVEAAKQPDGPRTLTLSYHGKDVLSETFEMIGGEIASRAFAVNTGKLDTGRHVFSVRLFNEKGRQDSQVVRIKVEPDKSASGSGSGGLQNVTCTGDTVTIKIWDHGSQDGDIVTLRMGGRTILSGFDMNACGGSEPGGPPCAFVNLPLPTGSSVPISITAHNEGSASPNTAALKVEGGCTPELQHWGLKTGETASIVVSRGVSQSPGQGAQSGQTQDPAANSPGGQGSSQTVQSWP